MKTVKPVELFLTLGLVATLGACGTSTPEGGEGASTETATPTETVMTEQSTHSEGGEGGEGAEQPTHSEGGEGGEGGEGTTSGDDAVDYATSLSLMLGHLMVAEELIAAGQAEQAEPHIGHPVEELYGDVEEGITEFGATDFKGTLNSLHDLIKTAPEAPEVKTQFTEAVASIDAAIAVLGEEKLDSPEFVFQVINGLLKVAGEEYAAAIANNQIVEAIEYQDSRGFVLHSEMLYKDIADQLTPEQNEAIATAFTNLKTAWPSVEPPATPVKTPQEVLGYIVEIEAQS